LLPPPSPRLPALPSALPSVEIPPSLFLVSQSRTAALPAVPLARPPPRLVALAMVAPPHHPNPSSLRSNPSHLPQTNTNGVSPRPRCLTL
jgi:hypothetical protein